MKKLMIWSLIGLLLVQMGCSKRGDSTPKVATVKPRDIQGLTDLLPEDTEVFLKFNSIRSVYTYFSVTENSILGDPLPDIKDIQQLFDINPFKLEELQAVGFNVEKPVGYVLADILADTSGDNPQFTGLLLLPIKDKKKVVSLITAASQKKESEFTIEQNGNVTIFEHAKKGYRLYCAPQKNYVVFGGSPNQDTRSVIDKVLSKKLSFEEKYPLFGRNSDQNARSVIDSVLAKKSSLTKASSYKKITARLGNSEDMFAYINIRDIVHHNADALSVLFRQSSKVPMMSVLNSIIPYIKDYEATGMTIDLRNSDLVLKSLFTMIDGAYSEKLWKDITIDKMAVLGIAECPLFLASWTINLQEAYRLLTATQPDAGNTPFKNTSRLFKVLSGVDIENEVLSNIGGNINIGIYDGDSIAVGNPNLLLTFTIKDEEVIKEVLTKAIKAIAIIPLHGLLIKTEIRNVNGVEAHVVTAGLIQIYIGIHNKQVFLATGQTMFEKALKGNPSSGFSVNMKPKEFVNALKEEGNVLYLNIDELMKAIKTFEIFLNNFVFVGGTENMQKIYSIAGKFESIQSVSKLDDHAIVTNLRIRTRFQEPFFIEVAKLNQLFSSK